MSDLQGLLNDIAAKAEEVEDVGPLISRLSNAIKTVTEDGSDPGHPVMKQASTFLHKLEDKQVGPRNCETINSETKHSQPNELTRIYFWTC